MAPTMQHQNVLPVTRRFSQLTPDGFRETISETWLASKSILDKVADEVESQSISTVQGGAIAAAVTGVLFGYSEFQRELRPADLALMSWQANGQ